MVDQGMNVQKDMMLHTFSVASVDNVDRDMPWKRISCEDKRRGFHGTSIQHVNPMPISYKSVAVKHELQSVVSFSATANMNQKRKELAAELTWKSYI